MKTVVNKTNAPLKITLPGGKALRLGPGKSGQIRDGDAEHAPLKKLADAGDVEIQAGDGHATGTNAGSSSTAEGGRGFGGRATFRQRKGDR